MTKRLTITLVALALFVLIAVLPASAILANPDTGLFNGSVILNGTPLPTVYIGESGLNLTPIFYSGLGDGWGGPINDGNVQTSGVPPSFKIGWWAPGTFTYPNNPSQTLELATRYYSFDVLANDFGPYTGNWYCMTADGTHGNGAAFVVADPNQVVQAIDVRANAGQGQDMTGKSVTRGTILTVKVDTNLAAFTIGGRGNQIWNWTNDSTAARVTGGSTNLVLGENNVYTAAAPNAAGQTFTGRWLNATLPAGSTTPWSPITAATFNTYMNVSFTRYTFGRLNYTATYIYNNTDVSTIVPAPGLGDWQGAGTFVTGTIGMASNTFATNGIPSVIGGPNDINGLAVNIADVGAPQGLRTADGFITIRVKDETGQVHTRLYREPTGTVTPVGLTNLWVNSQPWYLGTFNGVNGINPAPGAVGWDTSALDAGLGTNAYPAGTYTVWSETTLSRMVANYRLNGADYTGKTVSAAGTITLVSDTVKIQANKETVVRSKPFSVTITGRPLTQYFIWVKGTSSMNGGYDNQPPMVGLFQVAVYNDTPSGNNGLPQYPLGDYFYENSVGRRIRADVATDTASVTVGGVTTLVNPYSSTRYYAMINTTSAGTRTVEFVTTNATKAQTYTIRVEQNFPINNVNGYPTANANTDFKSDEVDVKVEKGAVTITASGDQSYYLGEEIKFSGTNTETQTTFLFITGPNLNNQGSRFVGVNQDPRRNRLDNVDTSVWDGVPSHFMQRPVNADNTWDWKWGTANWALDAGTYTIYAVSGPHNANNLANCAYGTVSIIIKKPFVSAVASQSTVAQGDKLFITGTAEGKPQTGIAIWIMGKNYANRVTQSVGSDASFSYEVTTATTTNMDAGQYFVVVQHPMQNQVFDIALCAGATATNFNICNLQQGNVAGVTQQIFTLTGAGSLQGTDAAEALVQGINSPNVDDTYTKLVFLVEVPSIRIDPIGDRHVGDKFTITATTNLAVDDEVLFEVYSSSFKPTQKSQSGEFSGATGTVKVTKGDTGLNKLSFDVDASTFKPDEYIVTANRVLRPAATATALFNVLEGTAPTAVPTKVVTAAPTAAPTTVATPVPTATPTKTPTQPGFGALVALIGLGAVAFFVVRRH